MTICTYYQQGRCRYGDRCRFEHPSQATTGTSGNRFSALSGSGFGGECHCLYGVKATDIQHDLTEGKGRPMWIFSSYAPARNVPRNLFGGEREQSMEEMRLRHYELAAAGNKDFAIQEAQALWQESIKQIESALNNIDGAVKYINDGGREHPNRIDITTRPNQAEQPGTNQPFASGQSSTLGQGQQGSAFGQPSTLGQGSAFGQPSNLGAQNPAFGISAFGQAGKTQPGLGMGSGFNQPTGSAGSAFGAPSASSPFAQISQNNTGQGFGAPAQNPFGQAPATFGQPSQTASPFGQVQQQQPQQPNTNNFGQPSAPANPFGAAPSAAAPSVPFGQSPAQQDGPARASIGPRAWIKLDNPNELNPLPGLQGETRRDPASNRLILWKGRPVQYINNAPCYLHPQDNKTPVRINFPDGPPEKFSLRDSQGKAEEYTAEVEEMYQFFLNNGFFKDGVVPAVPPKEGLISFDF
ncbi:hypothetical protein N7462_001873 [Penicillium macrosclerotiorum]|uniref:uncharacterized protein n=1 Tax=Penicillium macrosclerotiorum TaxID=303699 RepID=UPI002548FBDE|nr:uncharacterized protein N7462_001873 [Penicillium macrosclerotiorum]KAJ5692450.1 hypothetical protein N7462_001873 [Penicillium macrosclerotiorum]